MYYLYYLTPAFLKVWGAETWQVGREWTRWTGDFPVAMLSFIDNNDHTPIALNNHTQTKTYCINYPIKYCIVLISLLLTFPASRSRRLQGRLLFTAPGPKCSIFYTPGFGLRLMSKWMATWFGSRIYFPHWLHRVQRYSNITLHRSLHLICPCASPFSLSLSLSRSTTHTL